jgi:hypothetical protein
VLATAIDRVSLTLSSGLRMILTQLITAVHHTTKVALGIPGYENEEARPAFHSLERLVRHSLWATPGPHEDEK